MAYLIGIVSEEEHIALVAEGWTLNAVDQNTLDEISADIGRTDGTSDLMVVARMDTFARTAARLDREMNIPEQIDVAEAGEPVVWPI